VDFEFSAEQEALRASVRRFLESRSDWPGLRDLGVLDGELTMTDVGVVLEEMGRALYDGPYLSSWAARWAGYTGDGIATLALDLTCVPDAMAAAVVLVPDGGDVYVVDDFDVVPVTTPDESRQFGAVTVRGHGTALGHADLRGAIDRWNIGHVLDGVGAATVALELAVAYSRERVQFDRPIGSFQAVQHLCADMLTALELGRAGAYYALWAADSASADEVHRAATMAMAYAGDSFHRIGADAIQVFGGIGYTWEHDIHRFYKRLLTLQTVNGLPSAHLEELAQIVLASTSSDVRTR
jgi:hypothetical protein